MQVTDNAILSLNQIVTIMYSKSNHLVKDKDKRDRHIFGYINAMKRITLYPQKTLLFLTKPPNNLSLNLTIWRTIYFFMYYIAA